MRFVLFTNDIHAKLNALVADKDGRAGNKLADLMLRLAAERAIQRVFRVTRLAAHIHSERALRMREKFQFKD
jgi:hypothetical protein